MIERTPMWKKLASWALMIGAMSIASYLYPYWKNLKDGINRKLS